MLQESVVYSINCALIMMWLYCLPHWKITTSVSRLQSESVHGRTNLTFIMLLLGGGVATLSSNIIHMTLPLLAVFPLRTPLSGSRELVVCFFVPSSVCDVIHKTLVLFYLLVVPSSIGIPMISVIALPVIYAIVVSHPFSLVSELVLISVYTLEIVRTSKPLTMVQMTN
jgi:hypothetical protein